MRALNAVRAGVRVLALRIVMPAFSGWTVWDSSVPRLFSCCYPVSGITLWPFVFIAERRPTEEELRDDPLYADAMAKMDTHERIHIAQASEMLVVPFYLMWLGDFAYGLVRHRGDAKEAYRHIRLEQEAFDNEHDDRYLERRPCFAWRKYSGHRCSTVAQRWRDAEEELLERIAEREREIQAPET